MYSKDLPCLFNPTDSEILEREPLIAYSFYLNDKVNLLFSVADEIVELLEEGFSDQVVFGGKVGRASSLTWFWVLGAYEIVRTMEQSDICFSKKVHSDLVKLKKELAKVRMPAAKMEKQGKSRPISSSRSPDGWDVKNKDLWVNAPEDELVSARGLFDRFNSILTSIKRTDVLNTHVASYE